MGNRKLNTSEAMKFMLTEILSAGYISEDIAQLYGEQYVKARAKNWVDEAGKLTKTGREACKQLGLAS